MLTIFYDGHCPLCVTEMKSLKKHDSANLLRLVDLHSPCFKYEYPHIDFSKALSILHGEFQGEILQGIEVTYKAWSLVGKAFWVAPLNWPVIKPLSHWIYLGFAKYRHLISNTLTKVFRLNTTQCDLGVCCDKTKNTHYRGE